jgi:hypothetical protein
MRRRGNMGVHAEVQPIAWWNSRPCSSSAQRRHSEECAVIESDALPTPAGATHGGAEQFAHTVVT